MNIYLKLFFIHLAPRNGERLSFKCQNFPFFFEFCNVQSPKFLSQMYFYFYFFTFYYKLYFLPT